MQVQATLFLVDTANLKLVGQSYEHEITVDGDIDCLGDGWADPVLRCAGVRALTRLVHRGDEQRSVGKLIVAEAERQHLVVEDAKIYGN